MKPEEAIKELKEYYVWMNGKINGNPILEPIGIAISALEKQVPKKPLPASDIDEEYLFGKEAVCPNCRHMVVPYNGNFCPWCGQLIDWEDEE